MATTTTPRVAQETAFTCVPQKYQKMKTLGIRASGA